MKTVTLETTTKRTVESVNPLKRVDLVEFSEDSKVVIVDGVLWEGCYLVSYDIEYPSRLCDFAGGYDYVGRGEIDVRIVGEGGEVILRPLRVERISNVKVVK
jgi:hypothetical protein